MLISCRIGSPAVCTTTCGLHVYQLEDGWTCKGIQDAEDQAMFWFKKDVTDQRLWTCTAADGYTLQIMTDVEWVEPGSVPPVSVVGLTDCTQKWLQLGKAETPERSVFTHEFAHVLQRCQPLPPNGLPGQDGQHDNWQRDGINRAIADAYPICTVLYNQPYCTPDMQ